LDVNSINESPDLTVLDALPKVKAGTVINVVDGAAIMDDRSDGNYFISYTLSVWNSETFGRAPGAKTFATEVDTVNDQKLFKANIPPITIANDQAFSRSRSLHLCMFRPRLP
jgi:hypothetical protein